MGNRGDFGRRASAVLRERGISTGSAARALGQDAAGLARVPAGKRIPSDRLVAAFDRAFPPDPRPAAEPDRPDPVRGCDEVAAVRAASQRLVLLDNSMTGRSAAGAAAREFAAVHRRLRTGDHDARYERDLWAAAAELAEVAGWACIEAERHPAADRLNREALLLARMSGDRSIELLIIQNLAMHAGWLGRPREELALARAVLEGRPLTPRVEAMFRIREARGLMGTGRLAAGARSLARARSLHADGERNGDPAWAWWVTPGEIDGHEGLGLHAAGRHADAVPFLERAARHSGSAVGYQAIFAARLLDCLLRTGRWRDAEELARSVTPTVGEIGSVRTRNLLAGTARPGGAPDRAPIGVRDALAALAAAVEGGRSDR
ncbi:XRE family transcriptional regulator [Streptomyces sp. NPDC018031]|uniref:XRE family transcriptional regulator n=1 Tax=Streptomyces sp. NPDC018031 TaxID=3365033 RepID=UPI00379AD440